MTPKEKALEIAMRFDKDGETDNAVKCALICVDEMLNIYDSEGYDEEDSKMVLLEEVKQELNKL